VQLTVIGIVDLFNCKMDPTLSMQLPEKLTYEILYQMLLVICYCQQYVNEYMDLVICNRFDIFGSDAVVSMHILLCVVTEILPHSQPQYHTSQTRYRSIQASKSDTSLC
jgi:hypothetical protein